jgi:hypothetical protein
MFSKTANNIAMIMMRASAEIARQLNNRDAAMRDADPQRIAMNGLCSPAEVGKANMNIAASPS